MARAARTGSLDKIPSSLISLRDVIKKVIKAPHFEQISSQRLFINPLILVQFELDDDNILSMSINYPTFITLDLA